MGRSSPGRCRPLRQTGGGEGSAEQRPGEGVCRPRKDPAEARHPRVRAAAGGLGHRPETAVKKLLIVLVCYPQHSSRQKVWFDDDYGTTKHV
jgi:hypothetical protein